MILTIGQVAIVLVWSAFTLWTIRKFWWPSDVVPKARFHVEIKFGGLFLTGAGSLLMPSIVDLPIWPYWPEAAYWAVAFFPVMTWATYIGIRWFLAIVERY